MGIVSRRTRAERKRLKRLIRKAPSGNKKRALQKQLRLVSTATLDRGKLKLGGQLQRTSQEVAQKLVSGQARTEKEAQKQLAFQSRVAQRTVENKIKELKQKIKRDGPTRQEIIQSQALAKLRDPNLFFGTRQEKRKDEARKKTAGEIILEGRKLAREAKVNPNIAIGILANKRLQLERGQARARELLTPKLRPKKDTGTGMSIQILKKKIK